MDPHWLKLRWPITVLALGAMVTGLLMRSSQHPIQLHLVLSFAEPLKLGGEVKGMLSMPDPVKMRHGGSVKVQVTEQAPVKLSVNNPKPIQVEVSNPNPIQVNMSEEQPMEVDVQPKAPVKVKIGL
ncbi:MAG: hypothetical protein FJ049_05960 [Cyanobacteria bacterium M_surface_7_m2_037]|nr:hypothetical protein [Cyanobacteria bacterium M_surface_7_m2_037]